MAKTFSVADAKAALSECIRWAERGEPVVITRRGKPVAAIVGADDLEQLERLRAAGPEGGLASLAGGWEGSDELVRYLEASQRIGRRDMPEID